MMTYAFGLALVAHFAGIVLWVGGLLAASQVLSGREHEPLSEARTALAHLAGKLLKQLAHPGAAITVLTGVGLLGIKPGDMQQGWLHAKLALVVVLIAVDLWLTVSVRALTGRGSEVPRRRAKLTHGVIALLFLAIVILALLKP